MNKVNFFIAFVASICILTLPSCNKNQGCDNLPDLVVSLETINRSHEQCGTVVPGETVNLNLRISNIANGCLSNSNATNAGSSVATISVSQFDEATQNYMYVGGVDISIPSLEGGANSISTTSIVFNASGFYQISCKADASFWVEESNESNNCSIASRVGRQRGIIVTGESNNTKPIIEFVQY